MSSPSAPNDASPLGIWIPARLGSTRLKNKLLQRVQGRPVLAYTLDVAQRAAAAMSVPTHVRVITDSDAIADIAQDVGVAVTRVNQPTRSGTDRIVLAWTDAPPQERPDVLINLQGDEVLLPPRLLVQLADFMRAHPGCAMATLMRPGVREPDAVHVVVDHDDRALYFSRAAVPGQHPSASDEALRHAAPAWGAHIGVYAYRATLMGRWFGLPPGRLERIEQLEQLRPLEAGIPIRVLRASLDPSTTWFSVDTADDLARFRAHVRERADAAYSA